MMSTFTIDGEQQKKLNAWLKEQYAKVVEAQKGTDAERWHVTAEDDTVYPYFGAIGGELTYEFSPTGLGDILVVRFCKGSKWEAEINLTDYDSW